MKFEESLNVKFDESLPLMSPPLEDDDILECEVIVNKEKDLEIKEHEPLNKEIINIKESKDHPLETIIGTRVEDITIVFADSIIRARLVNRIAQALCAHLWDVASHRGSLRNKPPYPSQPPKPNMFLPEKLANKPYGLNKLL
ncbi:hypothetical protein Tco_1284404 [Tanacetum coccineum]